MVREPSGVTPSLKEGDHVAGYVIEARIGVGGFGEVYRARHPVIGREVAIKVLHGRYTVDADAVSRFVSEARAVNQISHPNIVEIFDFGRLADGREFCVMELIAGTTLRDVLRVRTRIPLIEALPILRGIAEAVDAAHAAGIAHRDLKPDNVFVLDGGGTKLIDFGLAKLTREHATPATRTGSVFGTPIYMSPEQCRGKASDTRTDLYSFGVLAYHVLVGEPPFAGDALELALHHLNDQPVPPSKQRKELSRNVDRVVLALLAKDPADRPPSLVNSIDALAGATTLRARRWKRRARRGAAVAIPLAIAAAIGIVWTRPAAESTDCAPASKRLAGIWDAPTRDRAAARFAAPHRSEVDGTWRVLSTELDGYAAQWGKQWTAACHASDHASDPLLYGQRVTCLENALIALRGFAGSVGDAEVVPFSEGFNGSPMLPVLADCESISVLRAQPPAPPPELRAEVDRLVEEVHRARTDMRSVFNGHRTSLTEAGLARLRTTAKRLDELGVPAVVEPWFHLSGYLILLCASDPARLPEAEQAVAITIKRAIDLRNDPWLPFAYQREVQLDRQRGDDPKVIDAAIERWAAAIERAGRPRRARAVYESVRAEIDLERGRYAAARAEAQEYVKADVGLDDTWRDSDVLLARIDQADRRFSESEKDWRTIVAHRTEIWGPDHRMTVGVRGELYNELVASGQVRAARDELRAIIAVNERVGTTPEELIWLWSELCVRSIELDDMAAVDDAIAHLEKLQPDGIWVDMVVQSPLASGRLDLEAALVDHLDAALAHAGPHARATLESTRAGLAFMHGDYAGSVAPATRALALQPEDAAGAVTQLAVADARAGRVSAALARLPFHLRVPPGLSEADRASYRASEIVTAGWVHAALGQWTAAIASYRAASDIWHANHRRDWNMAETDAWLGEALVGSGDAKAAIEPLEESLAITAECCAGFHYYAPMAELALARALWQTGGDKTRARSLAAQAREGYARLGKFKEPDRQQAIRWLAEHRAP